MNKRKVLLIAIALLIALISTGCTDDYYAQSATAKAVKECGVDPIEASKLVESYATALGKTKTTSIATAICNKLAPEAPHVEESVEVAPAPAITAEDSACTPSDTTAKKGNEVILQGNWWEVTEELDGTCAIVRTVTAGEGLEVAEQIHKDRVAAYGAEWSGGSPKIVGSTASSTWASGSVEQIRTVRLTAGIKMGPGTGHDMVIEH